MSSPLVNRPRPRLDEMRSNYPILRCNAEQAYNLRFYVLSDDVFGLETHYAGKTYPCFAPEKPCRFCDDARPTRWYGFVAACDYSRQKLHIAELTPGVMAEVDRYVKQFDTLRGAYVQLTRASNRPKARINITIQPPGNSIAPGELPDVFDLEFTLLKIFGVIGKGATPGDWIRDVEDVAKVDVAKEVMTQIACGSRFGEGLYDADGQQHLPLGNGHAN